MGSRLASLCIRHIRPRLLNAARFAPGADQMHREAVRLGIDSLRIIKHRRDSKVVARGTHPDWGAVILKVCDPVRSAPKAYAQLYIDSLLTRNPTEMFPRTLAFDLGYTVLQFVPGPMADQLRAEELHDLRLVPFVDELRTWCSASSSSSTTLAESECVSILKGYIERSLRRITYKSGYAALRASRQLVASKRQIRAQIRRLVEMTRGLSLRRTSMIGDMHPLNLIRSQDSGRLVIVDYEEIRPGNFAFDAAYLLVCLLLEYGVTPALEELASRVFCSTYTGGDDASEFFRAVAAYMVTVFMMVDGFDRKLIDSTAEFLLAR
jgi:hypothetical protein